jgi:DNA-directed RNA polymerase subunit alpha
VTSVRIDGVEHEFSSIARVKEDTTEFLLNVKQIRLRPLSDRPAKMHMSATGARIVTAADIEVPADYELVNPELYLATLDDDDSRLEVEFNVERGRGYVPAGAQNGSAVIGLIPVDAIFTPVRKVNYHVEKTRVGQETNYDRLVLEVWTDGTLSGVDAVAMSADVLVREFQMFSRLGKPAPIVERGMGIGGQLSPDKYNTPIEDLNLSVRAYNCLKRSGLGTVGQVLEKSEEELLGLRNFGRKSYDELRDRLIELGYIDANSSQFSDLSASYDEDEQVDEDLGSLGAALMEALREAGESPEDIATEDEAGQA